MTLMLVSTLMSLLICYSFSFDTEYVLDLFVMLTTCLMQFANPELMRQYGRLLEDFQNNTPFLNDCIFTVNCFSCFSINPQFLLSPYFSSYEAHF